MTKKTVEYDAANAYIPGIGQSASVFAYQHPDALFVQPGEDACVTTSRIVSISSDGIFETLNTRYVPKK